MPAALHGAFLDGRLAVWGESAPSGPAAPTRARRRAPAGHPYGLSGEGLAQALALAVPQLPADALPAAVVAWLPTADGGAGPLPSGAAAAEGVDGAAAPSPVALRAWAVDAVRLPAGAAVELLTRCAQEDAFGPDLRVGADLRFWVQALRLVAGVAARCALLPSVRASGAVHRACWEPLLGPRDRAAADRLAAAMPGACRALSASAEAPPGLPARSILEAFVAWVTDHLAREADAAEPARTAPPSRRRAVPAFDSLHDQWLHALRAPDGVLAGEPAELAALLVQARDWAAPIRVRHDAPYRLCFRLQEPPVQDGREAPAEPPPSGASWHVRYVLEGRDDPSLLLTADQVWSPGRGGPGHDAREVLLAALGRAAALSPDVSGSLRGAQPAGYTLDAAGAHAFLTETAPLLEQAGFGLLLPPWWAGRRTKAHLTARAHARAPRLAAAAGLGLDAVVHFDWELALGGQALSLQELELLARLKAPLVQVRGEWVQVDADQIRAALALVQGRGLRRGTLRDALRLAAGMEAGPASGLPVELGTAEGWIAEVLGDLAARGGSGEGDAGAPSPAVPPPEGLQATLRPYQARGYAWLHGLSRLGLGACLADDMGLGKTVQTLALLQHDWSEAASAGPVLLVCPTSVLANWRKEAERFTPALPVLIHHGAGRERGEAFAALVARHALVLTSYALLQRDAGAVAGVPWRGVVLDEAQNVKNAETKQAQAARGLRAGYRIALTGTPVENSVGDLWSIMEFLNPGLLGTQADFRRRFLIPVQVSRDPAAAAQLQRLTGPFLLRRLKTDPSVIRDLPPKNEMKVFCTLTREQASLYRAVVADLEEALQNAQGIARRGAILSALSKLKQVCNHPAHLLGDGSPLPGRSGKLDRLTEMLEEALAEGDRALIFTQFTEMGTLLQAHLREALGREVLFLHGGVSRLQRQRMVERFQAAGAGPPLFILSLKAGGTGLNLTAANRVFHFDRWWNPAVENQATDRAFRIGQRQTVQVHKFVCAGTVEEKIDAMIEAKHEVAERVVGAGETWLTELSTAELRDLLALRSEAVAD